MNLKSCPSYLEGRNNENGKVDIPESTLMCLSIGTSETVTFPCVPNGKVMVSGVPVFKHTRVFPISSLVSLKYEIFGKIGLRKQ